MKNDRDDLTAEIIGEEERERDRALREYERREEAEEQRKKQEAEDIYRELSEHVKKREEQFAAEEEAGTDSPMEAKTVVRGGVTEKEIAENSIPAVEEADIKVSERVAVDEKRPVHITETGRLPLSIVIETDGGMVSRIAQVGDMLPIKCTREFSTGSNSTKTVAFKLYAGERPLASQNRLIHKTKISGIKVLPQGRPVITAQFEIDKTCGITVNIIDEGSLKKITRKIDNSWLPSESEIYKLVQEAQNNLEGDNRIRERVRMIQQAREIIFDAITVLRSKKSPVSADKKKSIRKKCRHLSKRIAKADILEMTEITEKSIYEAMTSLGNELQ